MGEQLILELGKPEPPTFATFVVGANREAFAALSALAEGRSFETGILLWGAPGAGKSHLLRAAAAAASRLRAVDYCTSAREVPGAPDVAPATLLVVDDAHRADAGEQGRLFTQLNRLAEQKGQWVVATAAPPARLALREDLRTRLALGLAFEVVPLSDADKPQALGAFARERGFRLSDDVIAYLLAHGRRDMPSLVATLAALDRHSLATQRAVTVPLLRDWLQRDAGRSN